MNQVQAKACHILESRIALVDVSVTSSQRATILLTFSLLCLFACGSKAQDRPGELRSLSPSSLADSIRHAQGKEVHIFYIHGIGSDGPNDYDSWTLRKSICDLVGDCLQPAGSQVGQWDYANQNEFQIDAPVPQLDYLGEQVWKNSQEWRAAAPYAIHFRLDRKTGPSLYVDALNWWPLVFSLKCRQIVVSDAQFVAPDKKRIVTCSTREENAGVPLRFKSYDWLDDAKAKQLLNLPSRAVFANKNLKKNTLDWGFSDAVIALGPLRTYILDGIRQLILRSVAAPPGLAPGDHTTPRDNQEFIIVSHSLGSYLIFSALDINPTAQKTPTVEQSGNSFEQVLAHTSLVYFFANQLRLLELANLDSGSDKNLAAHLQQWGRIRCDYLKTQAKSMQGCVLPRIIALNDSNDLLTWTVPALSTVDVRNYPVKNSIRWFWLLENPTRAHDNYAKDKRIIKEMLQPALE